ncbi:hypothetical protein FQZ97_995210 [compost metagenome]
MMRALTPLALSLATLAGCSTTEPGTKAPEHTGIEFEYIEFSPDLCEHHSSWGHQGRGGAAMRKPTYQHVLSTDDQINTRYGKLHPDLHPHAPQPVNATVAVTPGLLTSNCDDTTAQSFPAITQTSDAFSSAGVALARAEASAPVSEYLRVRKKLCTGSSRLTYEEWLTLVNGTPKDIPLHLQPKSHTKR